MTTRGVYRKQRPNGKWDVHVIFYAEGVGGAVTVVSDTVVYKNVGPEAARAFIDTLRGVLDETYAQGYAAAAGSK